MEIPIVDIKGKEIGKLVLTDEVEKVLKVTGVSLMIDYDVKQETVIGYLH